MNLGTLFALAAVLVAVCWVLDRVLTYREARHDSEDSQRLVERFAVSGVEALGRYLEASAMTPRLVPPGPVPVPPRGCARPYCGGACQVPRSGRYTDVAEPPGTTS